MHKPSVSDRIRKHPLFGSLSEKGLRKPISITFSLRQSRTQQITKGQETLIYLFYISIPHLSLLISSIYTSTPSHLAIPTRPYRPNPRIFLRNPRAPTSRNRKCAIQR